MKFQPFEVYLMVVSNCLSGVVIAEGILQNKDHFDIHGNYSIVSTSYFPYLIMLFLRAMSQNHIVQCCSQVHRGTYYF